MAGPASRADLALRIYSTRLLGRDASLVLHGGGNTSLKTNARDLAGEEVAVLRVKGSGCRHGRDRARRLPGGAARAATRLTHAQNAFRRAKWRGRSALF